MLFGELKDFLRLDLELITLYLLGTCQMHPPNLYRGVLLKPRIVETDVNAGTKSWIKQTYPVRGKEQDTLEIWTSVRRSLVMIYMFATYTVVLKCP
jgi:hypothetical protein